MLPSNPLLSIAIILFSCHRTTSTPVRKCPGNFPKPLDVQIDDCEELPCVVYRGHVSKMDMQFVALNDETTDLEAVVRATVLGLVIPYSLPNDIGNVCSNLLYGAYCPLYASEDVTYRVNFPMDSNIPEVGVKIEVRLVDKEKNVITCWVADLKVRKGSGNNDNLVD